MNRFELENVYYEVQKHDADSLFFAAQIIHSHLENYNDNHSPKWTYLSTSQSSLFHGICTTLMHLSPDINISSYPTITTLYAYRNI